MVIDYTGASPNSTIRSLLIAGRNVAGYGGATWTGNGITSSNAAAQPSDYVELGYAENSDLPLGSYPVRVQRKREGRRRQPAESTRHG